MQVPAGNIAAAAGKRRQEKQAGCSQSAPRQGTLPLHLPAGQRSGQIGGRSSSGRQARGRGWVEDVSLRVRGCSNASRLGGAILAQTGGWAWHVYAPDHVQHTMANQPHL